MKTIKTLLSSITPRFLILGYHFLLAEFSAFYYGYPAKRLIVIGVTGTKGKTTTAHYIHSVLNSNGIKTGLTSSTTFKIGSKETRNKLHMGMPGRFFLQGMLHRMLSAGCEVVVVETTSEGVRQHRHRNLFYDIAVFTNLSPEHLDSHNNSFHEYRNCKGKMFASLRKTQKKCTRIIPRTIIVNADEKDADFFLSFAAEKKVTYSVSSPADYRASGIEIENDIIYFKTKGEQFFLTQRGDFNIQNSLPAIVIGEMFDIDFSKIQKDLQVFIPGRMEEIKNNLELRIFVDYAHEGRSMNAMLESERKYKQQHGKIIVLLGGDGGGRDIQKRQDMGIAAAQNSDIVIITNCDPYNDDQQGIANDVMEGVESVEQKRCSKCVVILDRFKALEYAIKNAKKGDTVVATGMGAQANRMIDDRKEKWSDSDAIRSILSNLS